MTKISSRDPALHARYTRPGWCPAPLPVSTVTIVRSKHSPFAATTTGDHVRPPSWDATIPAPQGDGHGGAVSSIGDPLTYTSPCRPKATHGSLMATDGPPAGFVKPSCPDCQVRPASKVT